jgi:hypothetical protein
MLRAAPEHAALRRSQSVIGSSIALRPRVARPAPVVPVPSPRTLAVRGHLQNGSAAAVILEPTCVCVVSADRLRRRRVQRFTIPEILAVEEHRNTRSTELVIITATTEISVMDVDIAQAWTLCRELRDLIRSHS